MTAQQFSVGYVPGESTSGVFGGNSNWRGPIWMPVNYLLIESLRRFHRYYGDEFQVECPTGSGEFMTLAEIADELSRRLARLFLPDEHGSRPVFGQSPICRSRSELPREPAVPRVFPRRHRPRPRRLAPDRLDRADRAAAAQADAGDDRPGTDRRAARAPARIRRIANEFRHWLDIRRACFEAVASQPPRGDEFS